MWDSDYKDEFTAMQYALERQHNDTERIFQFKLFADNIKTVDAYKLTRIICRQVSTFSVYIFSNMSYRCTEGCMGEQAI